MKYKKTTSVARMLKKLNAGPDFDTIFDTFSWFNILDHLDMNIKNIPLIPSKYHDVLLDHNRYWFKHLVNPSEKIILKGVLINRNAISYIKNPPDYIVKKMLDRHPQCIKLVHKVTNHQLKYAWNIYPKLEEDCHLKSYMNISPRQTLWFIHKIYFERFPVKFVHNTIYYFKSSKHYITLFYSDGLYNEYKTRSNTLSFIGNKALTVLALKSKEVSDIARLLLKYDTVNLDAL